MNKNTFRNNLLKALRTSNGDVFALDDVIELVIPEISNEKKADQFYQVIDGLEKDGLITEGDAGFLSARLSEWNQKDLE